jgi:ribonuclease H / adenosylcobalamin/alpha-ribazole phosphatase
VDHVDPNVGTSSVTRPTSSRRRPRKAGGTRSDAERRRLSKASRMRRRPSEANVPVLWCDGGSRGNPGPASIGFVLEDEGVVLLEGSQPIGVATAALAEYRAVLAGLVAALDAHVDSLEVRTDSRLLVAHMHGEAPVRSLHIAPLADEIRTLASRFAELRYRWVPEAENGAAHRLAERALLSSA